MALIVTLAAGCAQPSRFQNDPRAAVVGPDYLDYIEQYPRDRDTQRDYPAFGISGSPSRKDQFAGLPSTLPTNIQQLQTDIPPMPPSVQAIEGTGWQQLEQKGMPLFLPKPGTFFDISIATTDAKAAPASSVTPSTAQPQ